MLLTLLNMPDRVESSGAGGRQEDTARGSNTTKMNIQKALPRL